MRDLKIRIVDECVNQVLVRNADLIPMLEQIVDEKGSLIALCR